MDIESSDYKNLSNDFITNFVSGLIIGITYVERFYDSNTLCSLSIYQPGHCDVTETRGYNLFKNKLYALTINSFTYNNYNYTAQPLLHNKVLLSTNGIVNINNNPYSFSSTFIIKKHNYSYLIENYILNIYM
jgi:hypothetical protein